MARIRSSKPRRHPHYGNPGGGQEGREELTGGEAVEKEGDRYEQRAEDERQHRQPRAPPPLRRRRSRLHNLLPLPKTLISAAAVAGPRAPAPLARDAGRSSLRPGILLRSGRAHASRAPARACAPCLPTIAMAVSRARRGPPLDPR